MTKFVITKKINLGFVGEGWQDCYLEFTSPTYRHVEKLSQLDKDNSQEMAKAGIDFLQELFISGKGLSANGLTDLAKEDLLDLPVEVIVEVSQQLVSAPSKKK